MPVDTIRSDVNSMINVWKRLRDCSGGRDAVLKAGDNYVPDLAGLDKSANDAYRKRGSFYNAVARTVQGMNGAIFQEAPDVDMPDTFKEYLDDITLTNVPFETFATEAGKEVVQMARYGVLVDMPTIVDLVNPQNNRPYAVGYCAEQIINWRMERITGDELLTLLVLQETAEMPYTAEDPFTCKTIIQFRVLRLVNGACVRELWRPKQDQGAQGYEMFSTATLMRKGDALTFIPFVFLGAIAPTADIELPPLTDLADVNLAHWRNSVDHEYGLHMVALPTPWVAGKTGSPDGKMKFGPSVCWELELNGSAGMLEFSGEGLKAIVAAMDEKKKQMATLGARLLEDSPSVAETASAVKLRHSGDTASLKTIAQSLELGLTQALQMMVWWAGNDPTPKEADVNVELNKEYLNVRATALEIQTALTALQAGEMSFETWYDLLTKGGWTRDGVSVEQEKKDIQTGKGTPTTLPTGNPDDVPLD